MGIAVEDDLLGAIESLLEDGEIESGTLGYTVAWKAGHKGYAALTANDPPSSTAPSVLP